jgi:hypothetical protein
MLTTGWYLAADIERARQMLEWGMSAQQGVSAAMDGLWNDALDSQLYTTLAGLGSLFATGTIAIWALAMVKDMLRDETGYPPYERLVWLFVVCALLSFNGALLKDATLALRYSLNIVNRAVLANTSGQVGDLAEVYQQASTAAGLQAWAARQDGVCRSLPDAARQRACLETLKTQYEQLAGVIQTNSGKFLGIDFNPLNAIGSNIGNEIQVWMLAIGIAFQWLVEVTWLLLGLAGPLAVGGTLLPVQQKSLFSWLIGFYSVGLCKLFYNVLVGLIAVLQLRTMGVSNLVFATAVGLLSPILALAMAAGGGMATFMSIGSVAAMALGAPAAGTVGTVAGRAAGFAGRQVGRAVGAVRDAVRNAGGSGGSGGGSGVNPVPPPPAIALPVTGSEPRLRSAAVPRASLPPSRNS